MAFIDYYKILGVDRNIPQKDIRAAYRSRAKQFHPDLHPNDPKAKAKFQALNEAYDVLNDPEKRQKYDQYGERWREAGGFGTGNGQTAEGFNWSGSTGGSPFDGFDFNSFGNGGFSSFFQDLFGNSTKARSSRRSQRTGVGDMNANVTIDLFTAMLGGEVIIQTSTGCRLKLKVKPETQNGTKVRIKGKGYDRNDGTRSDLIICYQIKLPTNLNEHQKAMLKQLQEELR